jgi:hypothetical protein
MRLRTAMLAVAVLAILLGIGIQLRRRAQRLDDLARQYGRKAQRLEEVWLNWVRFNKSGPEVDALMEQVHWHDAVAKQYWIAAARPWVLIGSVAPSCRAARDVVLEGVSRARAALGAI